MSDHKDNHSHDLNIIQFDSQCYECGVEMGKKDGERETLAAICQWLRCKRPFFQGTVENAWSPFEYQVDDVGTKVATAIERGEWRKDPIACP
jgi:hypothetical protein